MFRFPHPNEAMTVYRFTIQLNDIDRQISEDLVFSVSQHPSETGVRFTGRVVASLLFWSPGLEFTKGICAGDDPDLWEKEGDGRVKHWIEVGLPAIDKLRRACHHARKVSVLPFGKTFRHWYPQLEQLQSMTNLQVLQIQEELLETMARQLERNNRWTATINDRVIYLFNMANNETIYSDLEELMTATSKQHSPVPH